MKSFIALTNAGKRNIPEKDTQGKRIILIISYIIIVSVKVAILKVVTL